MNKKKTTSYMNGFDSILKFGLDLINSRYKITKKIDEFKDDVVKTLYTFKRHTFRSVIELIVLLSGVVSLVVGSLIFVNRFFPWDAILAIYGLLVLIFTALMVKLNP